MSSLIQEQLEVLARVQKRLSLTQDIIDALRERECAVVREARGWDESDEDGLDIDRADERVLEAFNAYRDWEREQRRLARRREASDETGQGI